MKPERIHQKSPLRSEMKEEFRVDGRTAFLIRPIGAQHAGPMPWVWYAPTLPGLPGEEEHWMFHRFLDRGIAIAGVDVGESYGSPEGRAIFTAFHRAMVEERGLNERVSLLARSRGGLMLYNWAVEHPASVACIAGIYPVCNLRSYPGLDQASAAYDMSLEGLTARLSDHNPIDRLAPLAQARVPIFHVHGDSDTTVSLAANSGELKNQYSALGGTMNLKVVKGGGHDRNPSWFQCEDLIAFVIAHATMARPD